MHLTSLLVLGLSAGALSLPLTNSTSSSFDKRFTHGWVGAFGAPDCDPSSMDNTEPRPKLPKGECVQWDPQQQYVGIDWGQGEVDGFSVFRAYEDDSCTIVATTITNTKGTAGDCISLENLGNNGAYGGAFVSYGHWESVKAIS